MPVFTDKDYKLFSKLGPRAVYGQSLLRLAEKNPQVVALSADLGSSSGLERFRITYPNRFFDVGIAEQNLVGISAGLAKEGYIPFASSFAPFITMRAAEQVRMNLGYMHLNVKLVAIGSGLSMGFLGNSHFGLEDLAIMRSIPDLVVLSPSDGLEIVKCVEAVSEFSGPVFIRLTGQPNMPIVYDHDYEFTIGKSVLLRQGSELALIATGSMVSLAIEVASELDKLGISTEVINMHTIKPIDTGALMNLGQRSIPIVTIEEHSIIGGLGSAISDYFSDSQTVTKILRIALPDQFGPTGEYSFLLDYHGLTTNKIITKILDSGLLT